MMLTTGAASLSLMTMRCSHHHDPPSSGGRQRGGGRSSLRCPASPVERMLPCANSDQTSPHRHPRLRLPTWQANPRRLRVVGSHPEGGDVRQRHAPPRLGGGSIVPRAIRLRQGGGAMAVRRLPATTCSAGRGTRTNTASRIFHRSGGVVGGVVEHDGSTLAKLGGAMTDTPLVILTCTVASATMMTTTATMTTTMRGGGLLWTVLADATAAARDLVLARRAWAAVVAAHDDDNNDQPTTAKEAILPSRPE